MNEDWLVPLLLLTVFGAGVGLGLMLGLKTNAVRRHAQWLERELEKTRDELTSYQTQVTGHFAETARIFNGLSDNYQAVYRHLASGCQELCRGDHPKIAHQGAVEQIGAEPHLARSIIPADRPKGAVPPSPEVNEGLGIG